MSDTDQRSRRTVEDCENDLRGLIAKQSFDEIDAPIDDSIAVATYLDYAGSKRTDSELERMLGLSDPLDENERANA